MSTSPKDRDSPLFLPDDSSNDDERPLSNSHRSPPSKNAPGGSETEGSSEDSTQSDGEYVVEKILARAPDPNDPDQEMFLVKWEGYNYYESTWEPLENLRHSQAALDLFLKNEDDFDIEAFEKQKREWLKHQKEKAIQEMKRAKAQGTVFRVRQGMSNLGRR
ncbi:hypothetical protein NEOLI_003274 [Neolecta irregularis DAH-3]|uniref:Chromo domain-containing protein n=1 Tax=Neolecta irregularis (strain DAH-3) TaxID=1198029 RepID=A0A1U7LRJ9_NEOID|nr:hypothetical protein NEOLI_003274 [Neolecta irregularis DAH-3]|eukprot:OLL25296.1 hypothetical protein NEOLI_003274 [Neolecta irregularis DAH-3]